MKGSAPWLPLGMCTLLVLMPAPVMAQSFYAGAGLGPTVVLDGISGGRTVYRQFYGVLGFQSAGPVGVRLAGAETFGFGWLNADLTYKVGRYPIEPYAFAGGGLRIAVMSDSNPIATGGAGLRFGLGRRLGLFAEGRLYRILASAPQKTFLALTVGVLLAF